MNVYQFLTNNWITIVEDFVKKSKFDDDLKVSSGKDDLTVIIKQSSLECPDVDVIGKMKIIMREQELIQFNIEKFNFSCNKTSIDVFKYLTEIIAHVIKKLPQPEGKVPKLRVFVERDTSKYSIISGLEHASFKEFRDLNKLYFAYALSHAETILLNSSDDFKKFCKKSFWHNILAIGTTETTVEQQRNDIYNAFSFVTHNGELDGNPILNFDPAHDFLYTGNINLNIKQIQPHVFKIVENYSITNFFKYLMNRVTHIIKEDHAINENELEFWCKILKKTEPWIKKFKTLFENFIVLGDVPYPTAHQSKIEFEKLIELENRLQKRKREIETALDIHNDNVESIFDRNPSHTNFAKYSSRSLDLRNELQAINKRLAKIESMKPKEPDWVAKNNKMEEDELERSYSYPSVTPPFIENKRSHTRQKKRKWRYGSPSVKKSSVKSINNNASRKKKSK
jgi:hypothetical protein